MSALFLRSGAMVAGFLLLSGCVAAGSVLPEEVPDVGELLRTASGALQTIRQQTADAVELGKKGVEGAKEEAADLQRRATLIREGMKQVNEGRKMIQEGLTN